MQFPYLLLTVTFAVATVFAFVGLAPFVQWFVVAVKNRNMREAKWSLSWITPGLALYLAVVGFLVFKS